MTEPSAEPPNQPTTLTLYVTRDAPRSNRARQNLAEALRELKLERQVRVEEVDLIEDPATAIKAGIFATPSLINPGQTNGVLAGDLSNRPILSRFLREALQPG